MGGGSSTQAKPLRGATAIPPALAAALEEAGLNQYAAAMVAEGWDDVRHLSSLDDASLYDVAADVEMKRGHAARFVSHFGGGRAGGGGGGERGGLGASSRREGLDRSGGARQGSRSIRSYEAADLVAEPLDEESLSDMVILAVEGPVEAPRAADATAKAGKKEKKARRESAAEEPQSEGPPASAEEGGSSSKKAQRRTSVQPAGGPEGGQADGSPSAEGEEEGASPRVPGERAAKKGGKKKAEGELQADAGGEAEGEGEGGKATREKKSKKRAGAA